jgi:Flp pilus assembly pilin Flp
MRVIGRRATDAGKKRHFTRAETTMRTLVAFWKDQSGTETLEWGLVCGLIVLGAITALALIGPKVTGMWNDLNNGIPPAD